MKRLTNLMSASRARFTDTQLSEPTRDQVEFAMWNPTGAAPMPSSGQSEWNKDHRDFVLNVLLPKLHMPIKVRRIATEAYLSGMEMASDGSSVVPNALKYGRIKDWPGVLHDYIFTLHHLGRPDAFGHTWSWVEANNAYRDAWVADGETLRGDLWWTGLMIGSWPVWNGWIGTGGGNGSWWNNLRTPSPRFG